LIVFFVLLLPLVGALAALFVWLYRFGYGKYMGWAAYLAVACLLVTHIGNLDQKDWTSPVFSFFELCLFLLVEVGIYLFLIFAADERFKKNPMENLLFQITAITLMICPLFVIGYASDFCMRVSIPGLLVIYLWCIRIFDDKIERNNEFNLMVNQPTAAHAYKLRNRKANILAWILVAALAIGAVTPIHEIVRTYYNSRGEYEITIGSPEGLYGQDNFSGYSIGIFWDYFAKEPKEMDPITVSLPDPLSYYTSTSK